MGTISRDMSNETMVMTYFRVLPCLHHPPTILKEGLYIMLQGGVGVGVLLISLPHRYP